MAPVTGTWTADVVGKPGGFAAGVTAFPPATESPLMMSVDVGTKLESMRRARMMWSRLHPLRCGWTIPPQKGLDRRLSRRGRPRPGSSHRHRRIVAASLRATPVALLGGETPSILVMISDVPPTSPARLWRQEGGRTGRCVA